MSDVWPLVHAERRALIAFLEGVDDARWDTPSLCPGWSVRDVVAHQISTADTTRLGFVQGMVRARFDFDRDNRSGVDRELGSKEQMLDRFRSLVDRTSGPKEHVAGLRLRATDADVTVGDGPEASGPLLALLPAVSGRTVALTELAGPGADVLAARVG